MIKISAKRQLAKLLNKCHWEYDFDSDDGPFKIVYKGHVIKYYSPDQTRYQFFKFETLHEDMNKFARKLGSEKVAKVFNNYFRLKLFDDYLW